MTVSIIFNDMHRTKTVYNKVKEIEIHTYNFLELVYADDSYEEFNLDSIFSYKVDFTD